MAALQLSDGNPDGTTLGQSATDLISFYGATPVVKPTSASQAAVTATIGAAFTTAGLVISQVATSGKWAFSNSTQAALVKTKINQLRVDSLANKVLLNQIRAELVELGLIVGS